MVVEIVLPGVSPSTAVGTAPATAYGIKIYISSSSGVVLTR